MTANRKLAAILSADVAGYSRLMADDEAATIAALNDARSLLRAEIESRGGRVIDTAGDSLLADFASPVQAVSAAVEAQSRLARSNASRPAHRQMHFRVGINLGDVVEEAGALYGDGVNVAARIQELAEPGSVAISGTVFDQVDGRSGMRFKYIGEQSVKNIIKPVRVYRVMSGHGAIASRKPSRSRRRTALAGGVAALLLAVVGVWWMASPWNAMRERPSSAHEMPSGPTIAVLPFENLSGDAKQDYLADGITDQIITELSRFRNLNVIARNSSFTYKGRAVDVRDVGRELNARYLVAGSVQRSEDTLRVRVQLLDASTGAHRWAETYERDLRSAKLFGVQDDISERVVSAIGDAHGVVSRATFGQSRSTEGASNLDAYECVLRSYAYQRVMTPDEHASVRDCLEKAVKLDPRYAEAWASLAAMYVEEYSQGFNTRSEPLSRAIEAATKAISIDPSSQQAQLRLATAHFFRHDIPAFTSAANEAIALNPNSADTLAWAGIFVTYAYQGDPAERARGVAMMRRAMLLSPMYPGWYHFPIAWDYYYNGQYEEALREARKINMPDYYWTRALLITIYGALGRPDDATPEIAALLKLFPKFPAKMREETRKWNTPENFIRMNVQNLRRAGLDMPDR